MNIDPEFLCKICAHKAWAHYESICGGEPFCIKCYSTNRFQEPNFFTGAIHKFVADNLEYLNSLHEDKVNGQTITSR
jgi:hypothetical protein